MLARFGRISEYFATRKWLCLIALVGLALRLWGVGFGLPSLNDPDEPLFVLSGMTLIAQKTLNPGWFGHPGTTTIYALALIDLLIIAGALLSGKYANLQEFALHAYSDPSILFLAGRLYAVMCGMLTILLTYKVVCRLTSKRVGLVSAALLALMPLHVSYSQIVRTDINASVFMLLCLWWTIKIADQGRLKNYAIAGAMVGLSAATKWPTATIIIGPICVGMFRAIADTADRQRHIRNIAILGLASVGTLIIVSPYLLIEYQTVIGNLLGEFQTKHVSIKSGDSFWHIISLYIFDMLHRSIGWLGIALAALGLFQAMRSGRTMFAIMVAPLFLFAIMLGMQSLVWERWLLPILPFIAFYIAYALCWLWDLATPRLGRVLSRVAMATVLITLLAPMLARDWGQSRERQNDTRNLASNWARSHVPSGSTIALEHFAFDLLSPRWRFLLPAGDAGCLEAMTQLTQKVAYSKVKTWRGARTVVDFGTLDAASLRTCRADYAIFSHYDRYVAERSAYPDEAALYEEFARGGTLVAVFRPKPSEIGGPVVRIVKLGHYTDLAR